MIYTVTLNPSIDYFIELDDFKVGELNRIKNDRKSPGGKGINVSTVLQNVGISSVALGFVGGFTGKFLVDTLTEKNIQTDFVAVEGDTRINVKLHSNIETEINGAGPKITSVELEQLFEKFNQLQKGDVLVLAGSIPSSLPSTLYQQVTNNLQDREVKVVVDATKDLLVEVLPYKPFLIKPNHHELGEIFGVEIKSAEEAIPYGKKLIEMGAEHVIVSMADKGSLLFVGNEVYSANIPDGKLINSVGAGDSVVAGFIASYSKNQNATEAFRFGATAGSATAYLEGLATEEKINELISQVQVKKL
ncbi:1-phosphofructokinase [Fredinandcohnia sp. QZ13]|uniref:1-phosphofructokinase n=1 Tax=Fredinandcohnia sp. QZ13 TaxID=3073144 RepID=UPI0028530D3C|nr:1-phosphofructokinase [Fredinandcohnia sp. QZ13]MDR4890358.1 1-phosphofructokinase [Fredinandcohnia sp. QZ13]